MILRLFFFFLIFSTIQSRNCSIAWRYNFHQTVQICSWISGIVLASNVIFEGIFSWIQKSTYLAFEFDLENIWKCLFKFSLRGKAFIACLRQNLFYRVIDFEGNHRNILKKNPIVQKKSKKLDVYSPFWFIRIGKEKHTCPKILHSKRVKLKIITQMISHIEQKIIIRWKKEPVYCLCPFQKAKI